MSTSLFRARGSSLVLPGIYRASATVFRKISVTHSPLCVCVSLVLGFTVNNPSKVGNHGNNQEKSKTRKWRMWLIPIFLLGLKEWTHTQGNVVDHEVLNPHVMVTGRGRDVSVTFDLIKQLVPFAILRHQSITMVVFTFNLKIPITINQSTNNIMFFFKLYYIYW